MLLTNAPFLCWQEQPSREAALLALAPPDSRLRSLNPGPIPIPAAPSYKSLLETTVRTYVQYTCCVGRW